MPVRETNSTGCEAIEIWRFYILSAVASDIPDALIVAHDHQKIRTCGRTLQ